jgi:Flp pilus assembly protein TadD
MQQAMLLSPRDSRTMIELGRLYEKLGRPDRAVALYERALDIDPNQPDVVRQVSKLRAEGATRPHPD